MKFEAVKSSNVEGVAYVYATSTLLVRFKGGAVYRYADVTPAEHRALMAAPSVGAHLAQRIKGKFETDKLTAEQVAGLSDESADQ